MWSEALHIGRKVIWASTFGERLVDPVAGRPGGPQEVWTTAQPAITYRRQVGRDELPESFVYDSDRLELHFGQGVFGAVTQQMRDYRVSGQNVLDGWLKPRTGPPSRRAVSQLDHIRPERWLPAWSENSSTCCPFCGIWSSCSRRRMSCSTVFSCHRWSASPSCSVGTSCPSRTTPGVLLPHLYRPTLSPGPRGSRGVSRTP
ncbi:type ISP restriction/modification enzyme [Streptomyces sp. NPDC004065]|uniref:type ISP restriction/modification enzyme n=1 Tax=Streptomyces sp. NPDC004065 TaxID=3364689 RepID=UPI00384E8FE5